jgi:hypothetical protein
VEVTKDCVGLPELREQVVLALDGKAAGNIWFIYVTFCKYLHESFSPPSSFEIQSRSALRHSCRVPLQSTGTVPKRNGRTDTRDIQKMQAGG